MALGSSRCTNGDVRPAALLGRRAVCWLGHARPGIELDGVLERVFVLHVFRKKSKRGAATPQADLDLIKRRLKQAIAVSKRQGLMMPKKDDVVGSVNVFEDLGYPVRRRRWQRRNWPEKSGRSSRSAA